MYKSLAVVSCVCFLFWVTSHHDKNVMDTLSSAELCFCCRYTSAKRLASLFPYHGATLSRGLTSMLSFGAEVTLHAVFLLLLDVSQFFLQVPAQLCVCPCCKWGLVGYFV